MNTAAPAVQASRLVKHFARRPAVDGVELTLEAGDCLALFGPNGAGKTTLLRLVAGLLKPTRGAVLVRGVSVRRDHAARGRVGLISHQSMLYAPLTARENVEFSARLYGVRDARGAAVAALDTMRVLDRADLPVRTLSRGLQQRVSIARAMVHEPEVVLLDEPYSGLDDAGASALTRLLLSLRSRGATLILVTHNVAEGLAVATHAAIMIAGRFVRLETRPARVSGTGEFDVPAFAARYRALAGHAD